MKKTEVLSPVGGYDSILAAVRCGADAIYLGLHEFSARQNAKNFTIEELIEAVKYCHLHGVKVYLAVNTLVFDNQFEQVKNTVLAAASAGVDAFIIQDLGILYIIRQILPGFPIHASTQMSIHSPFGAEIVKELGFTRVIVARELGKAQLELICKTDIDVEVFVHGALCMSISGQCYMSAMIGSRSANRGLCGQACRLPFSSVEGEKRADLSLKDLSIIQNIPELIEMGVNSIKIEGRMKRPEYVAAATAACRAKVDGLVPDLAILEAIFSRSGFTDGYFNENTGSDMFGTRGKEDVISAGDVIPKLEGLYRKETKCNNIQFVISVQPEKPVKLDAIDKNGIKATAYGNIPQTAKNRPTDLAQASQQLSKLGGTIYEFSGISGDIADGLMVPASELNELRRNVVGELEKLQIVYNTPKYTVGSIDFSPEIILNESKPNFRLEITLANQISEIILDDVEFIYLPIQEVDYVPADVICKIIVILPRYVVDETALMLSLKALHDKGIRHICCQNLAHIKLGKTMGFVLHGGFGLNITNSYSLRVLAEMGIFDITLSIEMTLGQISRIEKTLPIGVIVYGQLPLMLTRNCPIHDCKNCKKMLFDRTGRELPVYCQEDYVEILNSDKLYMADRLAEIKGVNFLTLKFFNENPYQVSEIMENYRNSEPEKPQNFTRGLFYRGIQ